MGKIYQRIYRKDQLEDHAHKLPNGTYTLGSLYKPTKDRSFPHTHLYQNEGKTLETGPAEVGGDHVHSVVGGFTSGPVPVRRDSMVEPQRTDFIKREGSKWGVFSESGHKLGEHDTREGAVKQLQAVEASKAS